MFILEKVFSAKTLQIFLITFTFVTLPVINGHAQFKEALPFYVKTQLMASKSNEPVVFANIINMKSRIGAISDSSGIFIILAKAGDLLQITSIGYQPKMLLVTDSMKYQFYVPQVKLQEKIYELGHVDVHFLGTYEQFKYKIIHSKFEDPFANLNKNLKKAVDSIAAMPRSDLPTFSLGSPVTAIYMLLSKEGKQARKYADVKEKEPTQKIIDSKFNRKLLENTTGLKGSELDEFALFCKLSDDFIIKASEYELVEKILELFEKFKKRNVSIPDKK